MSTMLGVVLAVIGMVAWISAVSAALGIAALSPHGEKLRSWFRIGRLDFDVINADAGPAARPLIRRYIASFAVFFAVIVIAMALMVYDNVLPSVPAAN